MRVAQVGFDRQVEVTQVLLEKIAGSQVRFILERSVYFLFDVIYFQQLEIYYFSTLTLSLASTKPIVSKLEFYVY